MNKRQKIIVGVSLAILAAHALWPPIRTRYYGISTPSSDSPYMETDGPMHRTPIQNVADGGRHQGHIDELNLVQLAYQALAVILLGAGGTHVARDRKPRPASGATHGL